ncbi:33319_t:CDS:2, partial [Racocetra persica]
QLTKEIDEELEHDKNDMRDGNVEDRWNSQASMMLECLIDVSVLERSIVV